MKHSLEVPTFDSMMCELFQAIKELGGSGSIQEIDAKTIEILGLTPDVLEIKHKNTGKTEVEYRLAWTRTYLKKVGILENSSRGVWALTAKGGQLEKIFPREIVREVRETAALKQGDVKALQQEDDSLEDDGVDLPEEIQSWRES